MRSSRRIRLAAAALAASLAVLGGAACSDDEKDEPQKDQTGETSRVPTSVEDTRTTFDQDGG